MTAAQGALMTSNARHSAATVTDALQVSDPDTTRALSDAAGDGEPSRHAR